MKINIRIFISELSHILKGIERLYTFNTEVNNAYDT